MARKNKPAPVVAELGRPETTEETAARKAENSRLHRQRQTVNNLVLSLLASLALVVVLVLVVPRDPGDFETRSVDVAELAGPASQAAGQTLVAPDMGDDWISRQAELRRSNADGVTHWFIRYGAPSGQYAAIMQGFTSEGEPANDTWVAEQLERKTATGTEELAGHEWTVYDYRHHHSDDTNVRFAISTRLDQSMLVVLGTDEPEVIRELAVSALESLQLDPMIDD